MNFIYSSQHLMSIELHLLYHYWQIMLKFWKHKYNFHLIPIAFLSLMSKNLFGEKNSHLTCQTQSRNKINVGALLFDLEGTESLNGPLNVLDQKGCPAWSHSRSIRASKPRTVRQSGFKMTWANEVTHNVMSIPSEPWTITLEFSWKGMQKSNKGMHIQHDESQL